MITAIMCDFLIMVDGGGVNLFKNPLQASYWK